MKWKTYLTVFISILAVSFPANIIGCGPDADPYDYYTSFFHQQLPDASGYQPFYYTSYNFLYDNDEPVNVSDVLSNEWAAYCGATVTAKESKEFVNKFDLKDLNNLYYHIEKSKPLRLPDSVMQNSMTKYFLQQKDLEALGYIMYAKKVQPHVIGDDNYWEPIARDSMAMAKFIDGGKQLYNAAKKDIFKLKYAYQVIRLAHYSGRYEDAIKLYDEYLPVNKTKSILQTMCLALKAGALYHTGKKKEAAFLFSKAFADNDVKRISNYISFKWSTNSDAPRDTYLNYCKTDDEKASMLILFSLNSTANELPALKEIYRLSPENKALEVLAVREINKLEETYYTPLLNMEKGGSKFYLDYGVPDDVSAQKKQQVKELADFMHITAQKKNVSNQGLFETGAAYLYLMLRDYETSKNYLSNAANLKLTPKVKDQWALTNLLCSINSKDSIDAAFEEQILPSIKWLQQKAETEPVVKKDFSEVQQWKTFYRNLMGEILAKRYRRQGELYKEALAIGAADRIFSSTTYSFSNAVIFLHNKLETKDVEKLYNLMNAKSKTHYENYLLNFNSLSESVVIDFAGTAYLREYRYDKAIEWFKKAGNAEKSLIEKDPFTELLYDQEEKLSTEKGTTKIAFAKEMSRLEGLAKTDKANAAKHYYKMAIGMYNITYYGHTWELIQYDRSGSDGYYIPAGANAFTREYYGCFKAHDQFKKAMELSADKNFKAKCLFMMAKCAQKQVQQPKYSDFPDNYDQYEAASKVYWIEFTKNKYFPQFIAEYKNTAFYNEAFNSCSYLRDFVSKK